MLLPPEPLHSCLATSVPGQAVCGQRGNNGSMEPSFLCLCPCRHVPEGQAEGSTGGDNHLLYPPVLIFSNGVDLGHRLVVVTSLQAASHPFNIDQHSGFVNLVLPGSSSSSSNFGVHFENSLAWETLC